MNDSNYQQDHTPRQQKAGVRERKKDRVMLAIAATFTLLLILFTVLLCMNLINEIKGPYVPEDDTSGDIQTPDENNTPVDPAYETVNMPAAAVGEGTLVVVNASHVYSFPKITLVNVYQEQEAAKTRGIYFQLAKQLSMEQTAYQAMNKMLTEFSMQSGLSTVLLADAHRSYEQQQALGSSTKAGYSDSHTGLSCALRVQSGGKTSDLSSAPAYDWIYENCHKYGFVVRYPQGKEDITGVSDYDYYFRYVGYPHAYIMKTRDLCLEEYVQLLRNYSVASPLSLTVEGATYDIYYVSASADVTSVDVPKDKSYTISGDNDGGFIVTVKTS